MHPKRRPELSSTFVTTPAAAATAVAGDGVDASPLMELGASEKVMVVTGNLSSAAHLQAAAHAKLQEHEPQDPINHQQQQQQQQQQRQTCSTAAGPCPYFRVSFASVGSDEDLQEGFVRLRRAVLPCQSLAAAAANGAQQSS
jgi:hypothetical protein